MPVKRICLGLTLITLVGIPARAQAEDDYDRSGYYLGVGLGLGIEQFENAGGLNIDTGVGFDLWGGYRFTPNLAAEIQLQYLDRFDFSLDGNDFGVRVLAFTWNLKCYLETGWVQPFFLVGIGSLRAEVEAIGGSATDFAARFGGGIDFFSWSNTSLGVAASYVVATGDVAGFDYVSLVLGVQHRF